MSVHYAHRTTLVTSTDRVSSPTTMKEIVGSPFLATHYLPTSVTFMELSICDTWVRPSASGQAARGHWQATVLFAIFAKGTYFTPVSDHTTQGKIQSQKILMAPFHDPASCLSCFAFPLSLICYSCYVHLCIFYFGYIRFCCRIPHLLLFATLSDSSHLYISTCILTPP